MKESIDEIPFLSLTPPNDFDELIRALTEKEGGVSNIIPSGSTMYSPILNCSVATTQTLLIEIQGNIVKLELPVDWETGEIVKTTEVLSLLQRYWMMKFSPSVKN